MVSYLVNEVRLNTVNRMLLLGIRPVYRKSWEKVEQAQLEHYHDIKRCVYLICNVRKARQNP